MKTSKLFKTSALSAALFASVNANADQQILDDLIVTFSVCVGNDCVNGENFGFDTFRLKENNLRLHFQDTSNSASFPSNDWRIVANDSSNGGANYLAIEDSTAGRIPFRVEAGAPANALYVEADGDIGIKTANPVVDLHVVEGNTPTLRLEQDGSDGFTAQTWDIAGNETNFFVRDATNGSKLPFRIQPSSGSGNANALYISSNGDIGLGDTTPDAALDINNGDITVKSGSAFIGHENITMNYWGIKPTLDLRSQANNHNLLAIDTTTNDYVSGIVFSASQSPQWTLSARNNFDSGQNNTLGRFFFTNNIGEEVFTIHQSGNIYIGDSTGSNNNTSYPIETSTGAYLSSGGVWTNASSRSLKNSIEPLDIANALNALSKLNPVTYKYNLDNEESYVGFIAEDVPSILATKDKKSLSPMDFVALLTKIVQYQQTELKDLKSRIKQ